MTTIDVIDSTQLRNWRVEDPNIRIVDVRTASEYQTVHIPGSYNIPLDTLGQNVHDVAAIDQSVVLVCQSGARATKAHERLASAGKATVHVLQGGIAAWDAAGEEVVRSEKGRWAMDRQVRLVAGSLSLAGIAASVVVPQAKWIAGGVAAGLTYSALSDSCAMAAVLSKLPYNRCEECDISEILAELQCERP